MEFDSNTRKLTSSTGFIKDSSGNIYNYPFYLGIYDSPDNYEESTEEEYLLFLESQKEIEEPVENNE